MANRLADLNRQKRDYAYSGQANIGDVPWLYAMQAEQAAANQPAGIGEGGGMGGDDMAAPNPQSLGSIGGGGGGGTTGAADTGMVGPGQTGFGAEGDQFYRYMTENGGQAGEPGGAGAGGVEFGEWGEYVDPTLAEWTGYLGPGPIGLVGTLGAMGMRGYNANVLDDLLGKAGLPGLSGWQQLGAAFGLNNYGVGTLGQEIDTFEGQLRGAGQMPTQNASGAAEGSGYDLGSGFSPDAIAARAQQRVGPLDFFGGSGLTAAVGAADSAYSGGAGAGSSQPARSSYSNTAPGRRGARDGGGGAESGGGQGHGGGGNLGGDRDRGFGGPRHDGGPVYGEPGEEMDHTLLAGEYVMNPEAVQAYGPETFKTMNALARMMRGYSTRPRERRNPPAMSEIGGKPARSHVVRP
ncbi:MAG: hypothetical protein ACFCUT_06735 [Kiloniellaceae bacterium]